MRGNATRCYSMLLGATLPCKTNVTKNKRASREKKGNETGEATYAGALRAPRAGSPAFFLRAKRAFFSREARFYFLATVPAGKKVTLVLHGGIVLAHIALYE